MYLTNTRIPDASHPLDFYFDDERDCYARFEYELSF